MGPRFTAMSVDACGNRKNIFGGRVRRRLRVGTRGVGKGTNTGWRGFDILARLRMWLAEITGRALGVPAFEP